jgi:hypothetical protein
MPISWSIMPSAIRSRSHPPDRFGFLLPAVEDQDGRFRAVEDGNYAAPLLSVPVHVGELGAEEAVGLHADLVGRPVVDPQGPGAPPDIDAQRLPGKGLLEDPLAQVAGEEQAVRLSGPEGGEEPQLLDADVLRLEDKAFLVVILIDRPVESLDPIAFISRRYRKLYMMRK